MTEKEIFKLGYTGPALESHEMNVKDLAPALLSIGELFENANQILNGEKIKIAVNIKATKEGSVEVLLAITQNLLSQAQTLFSGDGITAIVNANELLKILGVCSGGGGVIGLIGWLKNRNIKNITELDTGDYKVTLTDGETKIVSKKEVKLFGFIHIRKNIEAIINAPLKKDGIESVKFIHKDKASEIKKEEADFYIAPEVEEEIIDEQEIQSSLQIVNICFQKDGKWKFSDGNSAFFAGITDKEFLSKVEQNEQVFAKDDVLKVLLKRKQYIVSGQIKTEYTISKVLKHRSAAIQIKLPFETKSGEE